jgi:acyl-CoA thioesterase I
MKPYSKWLAFGLAIVILAASLSVLFFETQFGRGAKPPIRVACIGDSITSDTEYPYDLGIILGANYTVKNFGVGRTTISLQFDKPYLNQPEVQTDRKYEPNAVVIMLGTNDAYLSRQERSNFTSDYKTLVGVFQAFQSKPKIFITIPPPVFNNTLGLNSTVLENNVIPLIKQTANGLNLPLIDLHTPLVNHPEDFQDGIHPNSQGSRIIAILIFDALTQ